MIRRRSLALAAAALVLAIGAAAAPAPAGASLTVVTPTGTRSVTPAEIAALPRVKVTATMHGKTHSFEGPRLAALLPGAPAGEKLRGGELDHVVLVTARDGYRVAFSLAELDAALRPNAIILADRMDGAALPAEEGPWRVVAEGDLRAARSARMVERIELRRLAP